MKNLSLLVIALTVAAATVALYPKQQNQGILTEYRQYAQKFDKSLQSPEEKMEAHNSNPTNTWRMGINQFSDMTDEEFKSLHLGEISSSLQSEDIELEPINNGFDGTIDWRNAGIITSVKNQGRCGSCWAFAATAAHETYQVQHRHQPITIDLSEQQLVDCATAEPYGNHGCNGGYAARALEYIKDFGQTTEKLYPYAAVNQDCKTPKGPFRSYGFAELAGCDEIEYQMKTNPLAVRVDASNWKNYASGIFNNCDTHLNHAVFMVGTSSDAWTIKNSWTEQWGESGYIRLAKGNTCGVCVGPSFPV